MRAISSLSVILVLLGGCAKRAPEWTDPALPEPVDEVEAREPQQILLDATTSDDPSHRARGLALLISTAPADDVATYATVALFDPDAWVQHQAVLALAPRMDAPGVRAALEAHVGRVDAPATTRGLAGEVLVGSSDAAAGPLSDAWRAASEPWDVAPLAFAAALHGDGAAVDALAGALSTGELALDVAFLDRVGRSALDVGDALATGQDRTETELVLPYATARIRRGDGAGEQALRQAITGQRALARLEAIDYLVALDHPVTLGLLRKARTVGPEAVSLYAELALLLKGAGAHRVLEDALSAPDREVRLVAVEVADRIVADREADRRTRKAALKALQQASTDSAAEVRAAALAASGRHLAVDVEDALETGTRHEARAVRIEAAGALLLRER